MRQRFPARLRFLRQYLPRPPQEDAGRKLEEELFADASWTTNYGVLIVSSCAIATFGLMNNSAAVIIGAMLIAPLMLPLRAIAFASLEANWRLFRKAAIAIAGGTVLAIALSFLIGWIARIPPLGSEILSRTQPNLVDLGIAVTAGAISGFAKVRKEISDALAGTAIAVALMPPLCVVGLSLSQAIWSYSFGAFLLYLTNLLGIILACKLVYIIAGYSDMSRSLGLTIAFTLILFIPLGTNFVNLVRQTQLQAAINKLLLRRTLTLNQPGVSLRGNQVDWSAKIPIVYLLVDFSPDAPKAKQITPKQVSEVQKFISREMGRPLTLIVVVNEVRQITANDETPVEDRIQPREEHLPSLTPSEDRPGFVKPLND